MYKTGVSCKPAGVFRDLKLVVSMRPFKPCEIGKVFDVTARYPKVHGSPFHVGDSGDLGISDLAKPDYGDSPVDLEPGEVPLFWCCGVKHYDFDAGSKWQRFSRIGNSNSSNHGCET